AVGFAPDHVGDPGRAHREAEVVTVGERVAVRGLVRSAGSEVGQANLPSPAGASVRARRVPGVELAGPIVLPGQADITRGGTAVDLRHAAVSPGVHEDLRAPGDPIIGGLSVER